MTKKKYKIIIGVDEVGRGPLAGPVVACAFALRHCSAINFFCGESLSIGAPSPRKNSLPRLFFSEVKDSKQLSAKKREEIFEKIKKCPDFAWAVGQVSEKVIDKINILNATKLAMQKAVQNLQKKLKNIVIHKTGDRVFCVLVDGNMKFDWDYNYKSIIKGDQKVFEISAASIVAKVYRDNLMKKMAKKYPQYGFEIHKGYGTKKHYENLKKFGPCKIHRKAFL